MTLLRLSRKDVYSGNLILVNASFPIVNEDIKSKSIVPVNIQYPDILLEYKAATLLAHLIEVIDGVDDIVPVSGYRSRQEQEEIYSGSLLENGVEFTKQYVALPNHSEHQTGLAIDLGKRQEKIDFIRPDFPYEGICNKFRKQSPQYGFIERYKKGKEDITGIAQEPWHFRYVGYPHSEIIENRGYCLEEYIEKVKEFPWKEKHIVLKRGGQKIEIFYVPILSTGQEDIHIKNYKMYQVSGNNVDGCIVTVWK